MNCSNRPRGLYVSVLQFLLKLPIIPVWTLVEWLLEDKLKKFTMTIDGQTKLHPIVAEVYQLFMLAVIVMALWQMPNAAGQVWWCLFLGVALYRGWEILIIGLKWLLVDEAPIHSYRRSLVCFALNLLEISSIYTVAGFSMDKAVSRQQFWQVLENLGHAFKLEKPPLHGPYATLFSVESTIMIIFVLACVISGIHRRTCD